MIQTELDKSQLYHFADILKPEWVASEQLLQQAQDGLNLYQDGMVYNISVDNAVVSGYVQDSNHFDVLLDLDFPTLSTCSCSDEGFCRHKAALFFYLYAAFRNPDHLLKVCIFEFKTRKKADEKERTKQQEESARYQYYLNMEQGQPIAEVNAENNEHRYLEKVPFPHSGSVLDWQQYFQQTFALFLEKRKQKQHRPGVLMSKENQSAHAALQLMIEIDDAFYAFILNQQSHVEVGVRDLYHLHVLLYTLDRLLDYDQEARAHLYYDFEFGEYINDYMEEINDVLQDILPVKMSKLEPYLYDSKQLVDDFSFRNTTDTTTNDLRLFLYRYLSFHLFNKPEWVQEAIDSLPGKIESPQTSSTYTIALTHLYFLAGKDDEALITLDSLEEEVPLLEESLVWLHFITVQKDWPRLSTWLQFLKPKLLHAPEELLNEVIPYGLIYAEQTQTYAQLEDLLKHTLPHSYFMYADYLLERKNYQTWVELHLALQYDPLELESQVLKQIAQKDIHLLLPLYHQGVERHIRQKNRQAYQEAVRLLKKLRSYYKRLKKSDHFERYMRELGQNYKRLRALQQELHKGGLT